MFMRLLRSLRLGGQPMYDASMASIVLCLSLWIRAKTVDQDERGNAERRAIFVGLWPPMFWLIGRALDQSAPPARAIGRRRPAGSAWLRRVMPG